MATYTAKVFDPFKKKWRVWKWAGSSVPIYFASVADAEATFNKTMAAKHGFILKVMRRRGV